MLTSGTIAAIILIPLGLALAFIGAARRDKSRRAAHPNKIDIIDDGWAMIAISLIAIAPFFIAPPLIGLSLVGFNGDYMAYKPVSGQVQEIASRQIATGKSMETRYVFNIDGQPYGVDDTRAALVKPGDTVRLNCVKEFVWGSTNNGYACNWG